MVEVNMRIDHNLNGSTGECPDCVECLCRQLWVLGIHHQHAVGAEEHCDPTTGSIGMCRVKTRRTVQRIEIRRQLLRNQHLDLVPGRLVRLRKLVWPFSRRDDGDWITRFLCPHPGETAATVHSNSKPSFIPWSFRS